MPAAKFEILNILGSRWKIVIPNKKDPLNAKTSFSPLGDLGLTIKAAPILKIAPKKGSR